MILYQRGGPTYGDPTSTLSHANEQQFINTQYDMQQNLQGAMGNQQVASTTAFQRDPIVLNRTPKAPTPRREIPLWMKNSLKFMYDTAQDFVHPFTKEGQAETRNRWQ